MATSETGNVRLPSGEWIAEHVAHEDGEIALLQSLIASGEERLEVDLPNYLSLHQYAREALLLLQSVYAANRAMRELNMSLELATAYEKWRRPVGRPRKITLASMSRHPGNERAAATMGRPRVYTPEFLEELSAQVDSIIERGTLTGKRLGLRAGLEAAIREWAEQNAPPGKAREAKVQGIVSDWYKPLNAYRVSIGKRIRKKSEKSEKNGPSFGPLMRFFPGAKSPHYQQPPMRGKGKRGDANTSPTARSKGPNRAKP